MSKTFTCRELGGICGDKFSGSTFEEIIQKGAAHMIADDAHKAAIMSLQERTGENREAWMARMQAEFDKRPHDK